MRRKMAGTASLWLAQPSIQLSKTSYPNEWIYHAPNVTFYKKFNFTICQLHIDKTVSVWIDHQRNTTICYKPYQWYSMPLYNTSSFF